MGSKTYREEYEERYIAIQIMMTEAEISNILLV